MTFTYIRVEEWTPEITLKLFAGDQAGCARELARIAFESLNETEEEDENDGELAHSA